MESAYDVNELCTGTAVREFIRIISVWRDVQFGHSADEIFPSSPVPLGPNLSFSMRGEFQNVIFQFIHLWFLAILYLQPQGLSLSKAAPPTSNGIGLCQPIPIVFHHNLLIFLDHNVPRRMLCSCPDNLPDQKTYPHEEH
jgi:hypothetical protein